eukprot:1869516-Amphidinium_carterae.1
MMPHQRVIQQSRSTEEKRTLTSVCSLLLGKNQAGYMASMLTWKDQFARFHSALSSKDLCARILFVLLLLICARSDASPPCESSHALCTWLVPEVCDGAHVRAQLVTRDSDLFPAAGASSTGIALLQSASQLSCNLPDKYSPV